MATVILEMDEYNELVARANAQPKPATLKFEYDFVVREVIPTEISWGIEGALLGGIEVTRGGKPSNQFKNFKTKYIRPA